MRREFILLTVFIVSGCAVQQKQRLDMASQDYVACLQSHTNAAVCESKKQIYEVRKQEFDDAPKTVFEGAKPRSFVAGDQPTRMTHCQSDFVGGYNCM